MTNSYKECIDMLRSQISSSVFVALLFGLLGSPLSADTLSGKVTLQGLRSNADAVVYVEAIEGKSFAPPSDTVVMDQKGKVFLPKILPVLVGTTVDFLNSDSFAHNVFTPDKCADEFNLGSWPTGDVRAHLFDRPCVAVMLCNVHPEMVGYVVAVDTPYYAVTDADGNFTIENIPAGTYAVTLWHERLKPQTTDITVAGDSTVELTLSR